MGKLYKPLMSLEEALEALRNAVDASPRGTESVPVSEALGRVLAEDVVAPMDVPPFDRSIVDGYAVRAEDTFGTFETNPLRLRFVGEVRVGEKPRVSVGPGEAAYVSTGAPLPDGADAVVMLEWTERGDGEVVVYRSVSPWENVMRKGSDIRAGSKPLKAGTVLGPRQLGVLSALGFTEVKVFRRPRVAVLSTGDELAEPGKPLSYGMVYDVNSTTLSTYAEKCGAESLVLGVAGDRPDEIRRMLLRGLETADVVVVSGGASVGVRDYMRDVVKSLGAPGMVVDGVRIKPGKPTMVAVVDGKPVFCLPGHPTSALMTFHVFVAPILRAMAGLPDTAGKTVRARLSKRVISETGRRLFQPVKLLEDGAAEPIFKGSGAVTSPSEADGFVIVPEDVRMLPEGSEVEVHLFEGW